MTTTSRQHIADVVRAARAFHGLTQAELAQRVGVHTQTIGNLERGTVETSPDLISSLERELKIDLSPAALAGAASADVIRREMVRRIAELSESDALVMAGETLRFIKEWESSSAETQRPAGDPGPTEPTLRHEQRDGDGQQNHDGHRERQDGEGQRTVYSQPLVLTEPDE